LEAKQRRDLEAKLLVGIDQLDEGNEMTKKEMTKGLVTPRARISG
jgi:hypothetical protein